MLPLHDIELRVAAEQFAADHHHQWEGQMSRRQLAERQDRDLAMIVKYCRENSKFYRQHLSNTSATVDATSFSQIPFTTKDDLRAYLDDVASMPLEQTWIYYETTGTTGLSTPCPRSAWDSIRTGVALCEGYRRLLEQYGDHLSMAVLGPTELHSTGDTFGDVFRSLGHATVKMWPHSPLVGFERASHLIQRLPISGLVCTPGMAILLARHLLNEDIRPADLGIRVILTVGELATPHLLSQIGNVWQAEVYNCMYASQEASILAVCQADGTLRTTPLNYFYEIVDPHTGNVLDERHPEREGEMVVTHLYQGAKPLIRYRTGDMVRAHGPGQDFTITPIGRARDGVEICGNLHTAFDLEQMILSGAPPFLDYQVNIYSKGDEDIVRVLLEPAGQDECSNLGAFASDIAKRLGVQVTVDWGSTDAQTSTGAMVSWKAARIRDHRTSGSIEEDSSRRIAQQRRVGRS